MSGRPIGVVGLGGRPRRRGARGYAALAALMVVAGITAMIAAGFDARLDDVGREDALLCRLQARMAAESAIAVAEATVARGGAAAQVSGDGWTLELSGRTAVARGRCATGGREVVVRAEIDGAGRPVTWRVD